MLLVLSGNALCDNSSVVGLSNGKDIIGCFSTFEVGVYHVHTSDIYTSKKGIVCINYNSLCQAQHQLYPLYNITKMQQLSALQVHLFIFSFTQNFRITSTLSILFEIISTLGLAIFTHQWHIRKTIRPKTKERDRKYKRGTKIIHAKMIQGRTSNAGDEEWQNVL
ncbi:hypothetical protein P3S68_014658 [Capsicum galapagoense]